MFCFGLAYQFGGLHNYIQAVRAINKLVGNQKDTSALIFYGSGGENEYRGILGYINSGNFGGIWVWGKNGPKYFRGDEYTVYSFFNGCSDEILNAKPDDGSIEVNREIYTDVKEWKKRVSNGNFVSILLAGEENGGILDNLREVWAYDWWYFLPNDIKELCAR